MKRWGLAGLAYWPVAAQAQTIDASTTNMIGIGMHWVGVLAPYIIAYFFLNVLQNIAENMRRSTNLLAMIESRIAAVSGVMTECTETIRDEVAGVRAASEEVQHEIESLIESAIDKSVDRGVLGKALKGILDNGDYMARALDDHLPTLVRKLEDLERKTPDRPSFDDDPPWSR